MTEERAAEGAAAGRAALWDVWEQVEGRSTEQIRELCRAARDAHGLPASEAVVVSMSLVIAGGGSWTGDEFRAGLRGAQERIRKGYRAARGRQAATKPMRAQIRHDAAADSAGKTREQIRAHLLTAYAAHDLEPPSAPQLGAEGLKIVKPGWRDGLLALRDRRAFVESVMGLSSPAKAAPREAGPQPDWSRPPAAATRMPAGPLVAVRVELTDRGIEALSLLVGEWQPDAADHQPDCWLTVGDGPEDPVTVHLGDRTVGRLGAHASDRCRVPVAAAQAGERWWRDAALLTGDGSAQRPWLLRLRIPLGNPAAEAG